MEYLVVNKFNLEALEKRYLRGIVFAIYTSSEECEEKQLIESYTCKYF